MARHQALPYPPNAQGGDCKINATLTPSNLDKKHTFHFIWTNTSTPILSVELWDCSKSYDEFVCVAQRSCESALPPTWWELPRRHHMQPALFISIAIESATADLASSAVDPSPASDFTFHVPCARINWRSLHEINIGAIVHKKQFDALEHVMDLTLFGDANTDDGNGLTSALVLLQFACQYAEYCRNELSQRATSLQLALEAHVATKHAIQKRRRHLAEKQHLYQRQISALDDRIVSLKTIVHNDEAPQDTSTANA
ncbi:hypothetical protein AaE_004371 [Aphanomyces astaci]|uniref:Cilium assembly protein DZIP1 N-terminal domain-containing protein n=1 Tax=Aphanomyces astaci TaxID=112090 RepID=A0A6A5AQ34_APHAT|nr:hypothetical protein AaE_004371 [Aphanomyces astaci]